VKVARYEEMQAQMKNQHDELETQYDICHSQVRLECVYVVDTCAVERDVRSGRGSIRALARARPSTKKRIISNNSYAHDDQGDNHGQENGGLDGVLYKL